MSIIDDLHTELVGNAAVTAIVGTSVRQGVMPEGSDKPYIVLNVISETRVSHLASAAGLVMARVQIDCWESTEARADTLKDKVRLALDGMTRKDLGSTRVARVSLENVTNNAVTPSGGEPVGTYSRIMDVVIVHHETVPTFA